MTSGQKIVHYIRPMHSQRGITLFFALVALIAMALAGIALIRAVETNTLISGNFAFRNAALHAADVGVEKAFTKLTVLTSGSLESKFPSGCSQNCIYYPTMFTGTSLDAQGVPTNISWSSVSEDVSTVNNDYIVKYVIERLCTGSVPITDLASSCYAGAKIGGGTNKPGGVVFSATNELYFRVTVRVEGPRNTIGYVQTVFAH